MMAPEVPTIIHPEDEHLVSQLALLQNMHDRVLFSLLSKHSEVDIINRYITSALCRKP